MKRFFSTTALTGALLFFSATLLRAEPLAGETLPGTVTSGVWTQLGRKALPEHVSDAKPWAEGIPPQEGEARLLFRKVEGSGFAVRGGLYSGGGQYTGPLKDQFMGGTVGPDDLAKLDPKDFSNLGTYEVSTEAPLPEVRNVVLSLRIIGVPQSPQYSPFELIERTFPARLFYNEEKEPVFAVGRRKVSKKLSGGFPEEVFALQWDLSKIKEPVRSFRVEWRVYPHASITGLRLDQSTEFAPLKPAPEAPATAPAASAQATPKE